MSRRGSCAAVAVLATFALAAPAGAAERLQSYRVLAETARQLDTLRDQGFDITEGRLRRGVEVVATRSQARKLRAAGLRARLLRDRRGRTVLRAHAAQAESGWLVWRPYARTDVAVSGAAGNPTDNIKTQLEKLAAKHRKIAELQTIGHSVRGLPIYAMKVTRNARKLRDGKRPAVLYSSLQHAREWLAGETGRRTLRLFLDNYGRRGTAIGTDGQPVEGVSAKEITRLVDHTELWFILVANPDGYDYTFDPPNRLWRKNLRDNNGDGEITSIDGVDPNRNFPTHWNYDDEGSNTDIGSETYRGTGPASEPETRALDGLARRVDFAWNKNDHTFGRLLLYPFGWQVDTHAADGPVFTTLAGDDDQPGIPGFDPDLGAELYTTNGDTNDHLYDHYGTISYTPEGTPAAQGSGFVFQDVEADVQAEFERHVQFALDLARSAKDPAHPDSHLGNEVPMFVVDDFDVSYGDPQKVQAIVHRDVRHVKLHYRIDGGRERHARTWEWRGGEVYGDVGDYFMRRMRGKVRGADPGDTVEVWFEGDRKGRRRAVRSESFTYEVRSDSRADVLVLAAEDYTGNSAFPAYPGTNGPFYLSYYTQALQDRGIAFDVWDVDAEGRTAPHPLGVLSHYEAVVWYTGNDNVTRAAPQPGVAGKEAHDTTMAVRDFMNEGGRLLFTGVHAGRQYDLVEYPQEGLPLTQCDGSLQTTDGGKCQPLSNDFLQYWLGSYVRSDAGGLRADHTVWPLLGVASPFAPPFRVTLNGADSAGNQAGEPVFIGTGTHLVTSSILDPETYPQFDSWQVADWEIPGEKPFDPRTGDWYMYSQNINQGYKRLTRTITDPRELRFWTSYNTEADWDFVFVEAHTVGQADHTTLPDLGGHTQQTPVGESCESGWQDELHHRLRHFMTDPGAGPCEPTGIGGGEWHAASGSSNGWQEWRIDLSRWAGMQVEVSISFVTDWATLVVPGMLVDDVTVTTGAGSETTSFEDGLGGWVVQGAPPEGPSINTNEWIRTMRIFEDAAVTGTADSLFFGFGLEGVDGRSARADVMGRALGYLLR